MPRIRNEFAPRTLSAVREIDISQAPTVSFKLTRVAKDLRFVERRRKACKKLRTRPAVVQSRVTSHHRGSAWKSAHLGNVDSEGVLDLGGRDPLIFRLIRLACLRSFAFETAGCSHGASDSRGRRAARCGCRERGSMRRCSWRGCQVNQMKGQGSHRQLQPKWRHAVWQLDDRRRLLLLHGLTQLLCACNCMSCTIWHNVITDRKFLFIQKQFL